MKSNNLVIVVIGSKTDRSWAEKIGKHVKVFHIPYKIRIASAHKSPEYALQIVREYEKSGKNIVFIAIAGRSNALGGFIDANTYFPVINCPPPSEKFAGLDILSSLRMPSGVAPVTVLEADQAALFALKIFALYDDKLKERVKNYHTELVSKIKEEDLSS